MTKVEIIEQLKPYFSVKELVSEQVYKQHGDRCWRFFGIELLHTLLVLRRDILQVPLVVNNWASGGKPKYEQRGLRANLDPMMVQKTTVDKILYLSGHPLASAVDFSSPKMSAVEMRKKIRANQDKLPYPIRLENDKSAPTWVHVDTLTDSDKKITEF